MIIVADAGPLLHLFWVDALSWALPHQPIQVVDEVWREVERHAARALEDPRLQRQTDHSPPPPGLTRWRLDPGERAALSYAYQHRDRAEVLVLCDEHQARRACQELGLAVTGSMGLIVEAVRANPALRIAAEQALRELPSRGKLHLSRELVDLAIRSLP